MTLGDFIQLATLVASLIAAVMSYSALVSGSFSKVAEYRKDWNDRLRDDIARFLTEYSSVVFGKSDEQLIYHSVRIDLSLDVTKPLQGRLVELKAEMLRSLKEKPAPADNTIEEFRRVSSAVLDGEWVKLRREILDAWKFWKMKGSK